MTYERHGWDESQLDEGCEPGSAFPAKVVAACIGIAFLLACAIAGLLAIGA